MRDMCVIVCAWSFQICDESDGFHEWRLFTVVPNVNLKAVLIHNGTKKATIPIEHAANYTGSYKTITKL